MRMLVAVFAVFFASMLSFVSFASESPVSVEEAVGLFAMLEGAPGWVVAVLAGLQVAQTVAAFTETKKDDEIIAKVKTFVKAIVGLKPK